MKISDLEPGQSYADAEGNVRRIDAIEKGTPGVVRYTVTACAEWPAHVGNNYTACPKAFTQLAVAKVEPLPANL